MLPDVEPVLIVDERPHAAAAHEVEAEVQQAVVRCQSVDVSDAVGEAAGLQRRTKVQVKECLGRDKGIVAPKSCEEVASQDPCPHLGHPVETS